MDNSLNSSPLSVICLDTNSFQKTREVRVTEVERLVKISALESYEWNDEVLNKLQFIKEIEIHLHGWVFEGKVSWISNNSGNIFIQTRLNSAIKNEIFSLVYLQDIPEFILEECRRPTFLYEENGCDISYFSFKNGHVVLSTFNFFMKRKLT
jgi:hypothetical protein